MSWPLTSPTFPDVPGDRPETPLAHARAVLDRVALEPLASAPPTREDVEAGLQRMLPGSRVTAFEGPDACGVYVVSASVPLAPYLSLAIPVDFAPDATCAPLPDDVAAILAEHPTWDIAAAYEERERRANGEP